MVLGFLFSRRGTQLLWNEMINSEVCKILIIYQNYPNNSSHVISSLIKFDSGITKRVMIPVMIKKEISRDDSCTSSLLDTNDRAIKEVIADNHSCKHNLDGGKESCDNQWSYLVF